jgi:hypothetical protein
LSVHSFGKSLCYLKKEIHAFFQRQLHYHLQKTIYTSGKKPSIYVSNCLPPASSYTTPPPWLAVFTFFAIKTQATQKKTLIFFVKRNF